MSSDAPLHGVLPVDKPAGPTSHDVVAIARRALGIRRIGHTGTLDPFASGLLLLCLGQATRIAEYLSGLDKTYRATIRLGAGTDTDDGTGAVVAESVAWSTITPAALAAAMRPLTGSIVQRPPAFSAKKVAGQRMYRLARRGSAPVPLPVPVTVHEFRILDLDLPDVHVLVVCSSGTYVRALARDLGTALDVPAHLAALRRTRVGPLPVESALDLDALSDPHRVAPALLAPAAALPHLPRLAVDEAAAALLARGRSVPAPGVDADPLLACHEDELIAIGARRAGQFRPRKVLVHD